MHDDIADVIELRPDIPRYISDAIKKAMAIQITDRFKNALEFKKAMHGEGAKSSDKGEKIASDTNVSDGKNAKGGIEQQELDMGKELQEKALSETDEGSFLDINDFISFDDTEVAQHSTQVLKQIQEKAAQDGTQILSAKPLQAEKDESSSQQDDLRGPGAIGVGFDPKPEPQPTAQPGPQRPAGYGGQPGQRPAGYTRRTAATSQAHVSDNSSSSRRSPWKACTACRNTGSAAFPSSASFRPRHRTDLFLCTGSAHQPEIQPDVLLSAHDPSRGALLCSPEDKLSGCHLQSPELSGPAQFRNHRCLRADKAQELASRTAGKKLSENVLLPAVRFKIRLCRLLSYMQKHPRNPI